jgi:hypothetical protein
MSSKYKLNRLWLGLELKPTICSMLGDNAYYTTDVVLLTNERMNPKYRPSLVLLKRE